MGHIVALEGRAKHTDTLCVYDGPDSRSYTRAALEDFVQGLTDFTVDLAVWTSLDDMYVAYQRWAAVNRPCWTLGRNQFVKELKFVTGTNTAQRGGRTGFRFVTLTPQAV